jgi:hypothetical protein
MITTYSTGLKMYKTEYKGLSRIGATRQESIKALIMAYNRLPNHKRMELNK